MPNPTVPDFTELGARKLAELQANGYRITGYCFERQVDGTQPQRGFVGWWLPYLQTAPIPETELECGFESCDCRRYCKKKAAHGVADMKGGQQC